MTALSALVACPAALAQTPAAPVYSPVSGAYYVVETVSISDATSGANIYYTTDGTTPTSQSTLYTGSLQVGSSVNLQAIAIASNGTVGPVTKAWYTIKLPTATPVASLAAGAYGGAQTVTLSDSTPGSTIYYTTTGTYPNSSSPIYSGPFSITKDSTLQALATATNYSTSTVLSLAYTIAATAPTISLASGNYSGTQTITLSTSTPGGYFHYTTDGTTPTSSSTYYTGPFTVAASETVKAMTWATSYDPSAVSSATYDIMLPASPAAISPAAGTYTTNQTVAFTSSTPGAYYHYTTDGSTPSLSSPSYSGPFQLSQSETVKVIAYASNYTASTVTSAVYSIAGPAPAPAFPLAAGTYTTAPQMISITDSASGSTIYYTTDGSTPTTQSAVYSGPISVSTDTTFQAAATAPGASLSAVAKAHYDVIPSTATPVASLAAGAYGGAQTVSLSDSTPGATIYYTTTGVYPNSSAPIYSGPFSVTKDTNVQAMATATNYSASTVLSVAYTIAATAPTIGLASGTYSGTQTITLSTPTPGGYFHYTTDGSTPTSSSTYYSGPFTVSSNETVKAMTWATSYDPSAVSSATYDIMLPASPAAISPAAGTYTTSQTVAFTSSTPGAYYHYTTDGSTPSLSSPSYSGSFPVTTNETVKVIAYASNYTPSTVTSAVYSIAGPAPAPVFPLAAGTYTTAPQMIVITDTASGSTIYYTTDGSTPTTQSAVYTGPIPVSTNLSFEAVATAPGESLSPVAKAHYDVIPSTATPVASLAAGAYGGAQTVSLSDSTPGSTIHYTTTGVYPNSSAPIYTGPFSVIRDTNVQAMATATNYSSSAVLSIAYTIAATAPTIGLASGTYSGTQTITLSTSTPGGYFHYTTDGSTPTSSSTYYNGPFTISSNETIKAMTWATSYDPSAVSSATYDIMMPATPATISPVAGTYTTNQTVTFTSSTPGVYYHYTTDGSTPSLSSPSYSGSFPVTTNETVKVIAYASNYTPSTVTSAAYTIALPAPAPAFPLASGTYTTAPQMISITDSASGSTIYYTMDGTTPTTQSAVYSSPIPVSANTNFQAVALAPGESRSAVAKAYYDVVLPTSAPVISPPSGTYYAIPSVTLTDASPNSTIYYTLDGSYPTTSSAVYSGPISMANGTQINAMATAPTYSKGPGSIAMYTVIAPPPSISPQSGTFQGSATVTMTDAVPGVQIHYTSDGSTPSASSPIYSGPITAASAETATQVYRAMVTATGYISSTITSSTFIVDQPSGTLAQATVSTNPSISVPANFMGLSTNWDQPAVMMGQASTGVNQGYRNLLQGLTANYTAPLLIRVPGDDTQLANIQSAIEPLTELAQAVNVNYTLGVDLWNNSASLASSEASAWMNGVPNNLIYAIEIGNEPDNYSLNGARNSSYAFPQYLPQFQQWQSAVNSATGNAFHLMGPSMGGFSTWLPLVESALSSGTLSPDVVSQHSYIGNNIQPSGAAWPADYLLQPAAAVQGPNSVTSYAASAHQSGRIFRMDEINSFYNAGAPGISNTFSSALWSIDTMFNYLNDGVDGVNWISAQGTSYQLYEFHSTVNGGMNIFSVTQVAPLYYGLLVFSQMTGNNAQLLPVSTTTSANVSIWATVDSTSTAHVVVINKDESATGNVQITLPGYSVGTVRYLLAAEYSAINGVTFAGQTFDSTPDGTIQGSLVTTTISGNKGVFTLPNMPITSAALIDFN